MTGARSTVGRLATILLVEPTSVRSVQQQSLYKIDHYCYRGWQRQVAHPSRRVREVSRLGIEYAP